MCASNYGERKAANKILKSLFLIKPPRIIRVRMYICNYFLLHVHAFEQKGTQNLCSRRPILLLIRTSDYNVHVAATIINLASYKAILHT